MKAFSRSIVKFFSYGIGIVLRELFLRNISGKVLSEKFIRIFYSAFLPRSIGITEVGIKCFCIIFTNFLVTNIFCSIIKCNGFYSDLSCGRDELVESLFHLLRCFILIHYGYCLSGYSLNKDSEYRFLF